MSAKRVTLATVKSFAKKNAKSLCIKNLSNFDGMDDCVRNHNNPTFREATAVDVNVPYTWNIGAWFVGSSRDYFNTYNQDGFFGYEVSNSCGSFVLAIKNERHEGAPRFMSERNVVDYEENLFADGK